MCKGNWKYSFLTSRGRISKYINAKTGTSIHTLNHIQKTKQQQKKQLKMNGRPKCKT